MGFMDTFFGKRKPDGEVEKMSKEEMYGEGQAKPKFKEAKMMMAIEHEGKLIQQGEPGFDEAVAAAERAKAEESSSVEVDTEYGREVKEELRRQRNAAEAAKIKPSAAVNPAMEFSPEDLAQAEKAIEANIRRGAMTIEEALRDLELERSVADAEGLAALEAKEDLLNRALDAFRGQDRGVKAGVRFQAIVEGLKALTQDGSDHGGHADAAIVINRAIENMQKF